MAQRKNTEAPSQAQLKRLAKEVQFVRELVMTLEPVCKPAATRAAWEAAIDNLQSIAATFRQLGVSAPFREGQTSSEFDLAEANCDKLFAIIRRSGVFVSGWNDLQNWLRKAVPALSSEVAKLSMVELLRGQDEARNELSRIIRDAPIPSGINSLFINVGKSSGKVILSLVGTTCSDPSDPDAFAKPSYQPLAGHFPIQILRSLAAIGKRLPESQEFIDYALVPAVAGLLSCEVLTKLVPRKRIVIGHFSGDVFEITPRTAKRA